MNYLIKRPIAVVMAFLAFFIIGLVCYWLTPISLLPNIAIPEITIKYSNEKYSNKEIENNVISTIRSSLVQVYGLQDIQSVSSDGSGIIFLKFNYGTDIDLALIEVNEKVDACIGKLPYGTMRPKVVKSNATDIPLFYLNLTLKNSSEYSIKDSDEDFMQMCDVVENVIARRLEQLPEVAMADVTGAPSRQIVVQPNYERLKTFNLTYYDIEKALQASNIELGMLSIKDGYYVYSVRVENILRNVHDIENIYIRSSNRLLQLKDIANISLKPKIEKGYSLYNGKRSVTIAVISKSSLNMISMRTAISDLIDEFSSSYPNYEFTISRNQTKLLDYSINSLKQNLLLGLMLVLLAGFIFIGDIRSSIVVGIVMLVSIVITFIPFYLFNKTHNVVSLSGLILVLGMMIDNALVLTENIVFHRRSGRTLRVACNEGTVNLMAPLLSSSLTSIVVFVPLVFISGMISSIFSDQAFAVTAGLMVSYITGIILLPVVFYQINKKGEIIKKDHSILGETIMIWYKKSFNFCMEHKKGVFVTIIVCFLLGVWSFFKVEKSSMPEIKYKELTATIDFNSDISVNENYERINNILKLTGTVSNENAAFVSVQDFLIEESNKLLKSESFLYWRVNNYSDLSVIKNQVDSLLGVDYPDARVTYDVPSSILEKLFDFRETGIEARFYPKKNNLKLADIKDLEKKIKIQTKGNLSTDLLLKRQKVLLINKELLKLYGIDQEDFITSLKKEFSSQEISILHSYNNYLPITIAPSFNSISEVLNEGIYMKEGKKGNVEIPYKNLVKEYIEEDTKNIFASKDGTYIPICFMMVEDQEALMNTIRGAMIDDDNFNVDFVGDYISKDRVIHELILFFVICILLIYFILCAQFESFLQPIILLIEIPIDIAFVFLILYITGISFNIMSGIGIIVACGIVVNDSILKIVTINKYIKEGVGLKESIHLAGERRLFAIIMTSVTTIGAIIPVLFTNDLGAQVQRPLAISMISAMFIGTLVSIYIVPILYYKLANLREKKNL